MSLIKSYIDDKILEQPTVECNYCHKSIEIDNLIIHEDDCVLEYLKQKYEDTLPEIPTKIECIICNELININSINQHETECIGATKQKNINKELLETKLTNELQVKAIEYINEMNRIKCIELKYKDEDAKKIIEHFDKSKIHIHFKPSVLAKHLIDDPYYRNQFETKTTGGSTDLARRRKWESSLFNQIYNEADHSDRVKYGLLNITNTIFDNTAKIYGDSYFILNNNIKKRCSFTYGDSCNFPTTYSFLYPNQFLNKLPENFTNYIINNKFEKLNNMLNTYIEVQIHGDIKIDRDIDKIMINKIYKHENEGVLLENISAKYNIPIEWFSPN